MPLELPPPPQVCISNPYYTAACLDESYVDAKAAADRLAREISKVGIESLTYALRFGYSKMWTDMSVVVMPISLPLSMALLRTRNRATSVNRPPWLSNH